MSCISLAEELVVMARTEMKVTPSMMRFGHVYSKAYFISLHPRLRFLKCHYSTGMVRGGYGMLKTLKRDGGDGDDEVARITWCG